METQFVRCISKESIITLEGTTKREALTELIDAASIKSPVERSVMEKAVWQREKMMTTGVGQRLALPHIRLSGFGAPVILIGVCKHPLEDYDGLDKEPVSLIVFLVAPEGEQESYLKLLGSISTKFKSPTIIDEVLESIGKSAKILKILKRRKS